MKRLKILLLSLLILSVLFVAACADPATPDIDFPKESVPRSSATNEIPEAPEPTAAATDKSYVSVAYADDELLSKYASHDEFIEAENTSAQVKVVFTADVAVKDFKFVEGSYIEDVAGQSAAFTENKALYSLDELLPEKPLVIGTVFHGAFPTRGISFVDESNTTRCFYLAMSGENGSLLLVEF